MKQRCVTKCSTLFCQQGKLELRKNQKVSWNQHQLLVDVKAIGLCRTDLYAVGGEISTASDCFVPGHEFAGIVSRVGAAVNGFQDGDRIVVNPVIPCRQCSDCLENRQHQCSQTLFMGVDLDGACAEQVAVEPAMAYKFPDTLSFQVAAFSEPVAATLAILKTPITPDKRILLLGEYRIAELAKRVLSAHGFESVHKTSSDKAKDLPDDYYDIVIETGLNDQILATICRVLRPRGTIVFKSRQHLPVSMILRQMIQKEPTIQFVNYGRFDHAVHLLATGRVVVDDLIGKCFPLDQFQAAFDLALVDEASKTFLIPGVQN